MEIVNVRYILGIIILLTHFISIAVYGYIGLKRLDTLQDTVAIILSIAPLTSLYFTAFLRYVVLDNGTTVQKILIPKRSFYVQLLVILIFCVFLLPVGGAIFASGKLYYNNISIYTGLVETLFGAYLAIIFNSLFPETMTAPTTS